MADPIAAAGDFGKHEPMTVVAIDTHAVVKELVAAGFTGEQAETVTRIVRDVHHIDLVVKANRRENLAETKVRILKWVLASMIGIQTVVIIGAVLALARAATH